MDWRTTLTWPEARSLSYSLRRQWLDEFLERWAKTLDPEQRILDVGGVRLDKRGRFDIERYAQRVVYLNLSPAKRPDVLADAARLPFADADAAVVVCNELLEHVPDPLRVLAEARRVLRPGGRLMFSVPFLYRIHADPHDYGRYTEHFWRDSLAAMGFEQVVIEAQGRYWSVLVDQIRFGLTTTWCIRVPPLRRLLALLFWPLRQGAIALDCRERTMRHPVLGSFTTGYAVTAVRGRDDAGDPVVH